MLISLLKVHEARLFFLLNEQSVLSSAFDCAGRLADSRDMQMTREGFVQVFASCNSPLSLNSMKQRERFRSLVGLAQGNLIIGMCLERSVAKEIGQPNL